MFLKPKKGAFKDLDKNLPIQPKYKRAFKNKGEVCGKNCCCQSKNVYEYKKPKC